MKRKMKADFFLSKPKVLNSYTDIHICECRLMRIRCTVFYLVLSAYDCMHENTIDTCTCTYASLQVEKVDYRTARSPVYTFM